MLMVQLVVLYVPAKLYGIKSVIINEQKSQKVMKICLLLSIKTEFDSFFTFSSNYRKGCGHKCNKQHNSNGTIDLSSTERREHLCKYIFSLHHFVWFLGDFVISLLSFWCFMLQVNQKTPQKLQDRFKIFKYDIFSSNIAPLQHSVE